MTRQEIVPERLAGATAVVIDVFMATTTLLTILEKRRKGRLPGRGSGGGQTRSGRSWKRLTSCAAASRTRPG